MAKREKVARDLSDKLEELIRNLIQDHPEVKKLSELRYCEVAVSALEGVKADIEMRLEELRDEENDTE